MFDKTLFDRNAYDRSVAADGIIIDILSSGTIIPRFTFVTPIGVTFIGLGNLNPGLLINSKIDLCIEGEGKIEDTSLYLQLPLSLSMSGSGSLNCNAAVKVPFDVAFNGEGNMESDRDFVYQYVVSPISGTSTLNTFIVMKQDLKEFTLFGEGGLNQFPIILKLPLTSSMGGDSSFILHRLGTNNINVLELDGINLAPGATVTIDTDLLSVYFGTTQDVSCVTSDSVFFEMNPGENEIVIDTNVNTSLNVTAIWQNRWL